MKSPKVILLVEDSADDVELLVRALARNGSIHRLLIARDGVEAVEVLSSKATVDLVLLDLNLPRLTGLEVLAWIRGNANVRLLPVVLFTTSVELEDVKNGYRLGANSYVKKPVAFDELVQASRDLMAYWLGWNHPPPSTGVTS